MSPAKKQPNEKQDAANDVDENDAKPEKQDDVSDKDKSADKPATKPKKQDDVSDKDKSADKPDAKPEKQDDDSDKDADDGDAKPKRQRKPEQSEPSDDAPAARKRPAPRRRSKPRAPRASERPDSEADQSDSDEPAAYDDMPSGDASGEATQRTVEEFTEAMVSMITHIATTLVDNKDAVKVTHEEEGGVIVFLLDVDDTEKGRVIGRQGRIASAIRALVRVAAIKSDLRSRLEIL